MEREEIISDTLNNAHLSIKDTFNPVLIHTLYSTGLYSETSEKDPRNKGHLSKRDTWFCPILYTSVYFRTE